MINNKYNFIDLFAGAGGLAEGFYRCGFEPICHIEMNKDACDTLKTRLAYHFLHENQRIDFYNKYVSGSIDKRVFYKSIPDHLLSSVMNETISDENIGNIFSKIDNITKARSISEIDVIIGGPPCQAYSLVGRSSKRVEPLEKDDKNYLYKLYLQFIAKYSPKIFVFENVVGLLSANGGKYFDDLVKRAKNLGYLIETKVLNSQDYGVLQNRRRIIVIGYRVEISDKEKLFPSAIDSSQYVVGDILNDLPSLEDVIKDNKYKGKPSEYLKHFGMRDSDDILTWHEKRLNNERDKQIYKRAIELWNSKKERLSYVNLPTELKNHKNQKAFLDRFKVVAADLHSSQTMLAHIAKDGHYFIHPDIEQCRSISVREAARIQSFPDSYYFEGSRCSAFTQIGNAVPPLMAEQIAKRIKTTLKDLKENLNHDGHK